MVFKIAVFVIQLVTLEYVLLAVLLGVLPSCLSHRDVNLSDPMLF